MLTYNGRTYNVHYTKPKRSFAKLSTDQSGRVQSGEMYIDLIGTYVNYSMTVSMKDGDVAEFDRFFEDISAPVAFATLTLPYNQSTITFEAYVTQGDQDLIRAKGTHSDNNIWGPLTVNFIARRPLRRAQ